MEEHNPWWYGDYHEKYLEWRESDIRWKPPLINIIEVKPFSLNFIIGPRQIGKTTAIMVYIHEILARNTDPRAIFYYPCDEISDFRELGEILDDYLRFKESRGIKHATIFLDEITFVDEWWRAIKARIDRGMLKNDTIFISGSASIELIAGKERFPGRRGMGKDYYLLPLTFHEYAKLVKKREIKGVTFSTDNLLEKIKTNKIFSRRLMEDFEEYLTTGGFPISIKEYLAKGRTTEAQRVYLDWLRTDIIKTGKSEKILKDILAQVIRARANPISWNRIAKEAGGLSPNTVRSYIELLENLFVVKVLEFIEPSGKVYRRKNKKIHVIDPFLYDTLSRWTREEVITEQKVEAIIANHLSLLGEVFYWRDSTEIDVVLRINKKLLGFEVKWALRQESRRRPIRTIVLDRDLIPLFLASIKIKGTFKK